MDITMCYGLDCPLKETCKRFKGEKNEYGQSMFSIIPFKDNECEYYWEIKEDTIMTEKEEWDRFNETFIEIFTNRDNEKT